jgi:hypothetical protein
MNRASISIWVMCGLISASVLLGPLTKSGSMVLPSASAQDDNDPFSRNLKSAEQSSDPFSVSQKARTQTVKSADVVQEETGAAFAAGSGIGPKTHATTANPRDLNAESTLRLPTSIVAGSPLKDVFNQITKNAKLQITVHESARNTISDNAKVSEDFKLNDVPLATVLDLLLDTYDATYTIKDGTLVILSVDAAEDQEHHVTRVFNVKDIIDAMRENGGITGWQIGIAIPGPDDGGASTVNPVASNQASVSGGATGGVGSPAQTSVGAGGIGGGGFQETKPVFVENKAMELFSDAIREIVQPDNWEDNGGTCRMFMLGDRLAVSGDYFTVRKLQSFLDDLRASLEIEH